MSKPKYGKRPLYAPTGKIYTIGDVHNEADKLKEILDQLETMLTPEDHVVFCGDLVDRGPFAARTIALLVAFAKKYPDQVFFVRGNHDWMLENYLKTGSAEWMKYVIVTLDNLKAEWNLPDILPNTVSQALIDHEWREVLTRMIPYYETEEIMVTHAPLNVVSCHMCGIDTYREVWEEEKDDVGFRWFMERLDTAIMWDFEAESMQLPDFEKFRICGHQPGSYSHPRIFKDRAFIDTGCGKGKRPLTCMAYPGKKFWQSSK